MREAIWHPLQLPESIKMFPLDIVIEVEPTVNNQEDYDEYYRAYYDSEGMEENTNNSPAFAAGESQRYCNEMYEDGIGGSRF